MSHESPESMNPNRLPIDVAARMLSKAGARQITDVMTRADMDEGAPSQPARRSLFPAFRCVDRVTICWEKSRWEEVRGGRL